MVDFRMSGHDPTGKDWTDIEVDMVVAGYFEMLTSALSRRRYVKAHMNAQIRQATGRTRGSVEYKFRNISAVLDRLGYPWVGGYKPARNFQRALVDGVERYLDAHSEFALIGPTPTVSRAAEPAPLFFEPPPSLTRSEPPDEPPFLTRLARKFDPVQRDARNRELGERGEEKVFKHERARLVHEGRGDLATKVRWISREEGDGAGYDILSFDVAGSERLLEVKTTVGHQRTPFYLTENERSLSVERPDAFRLVRLYDFARSPRAFELIPPLENSVLLRANSYRATFV